MTSCKNCGKEKNIAAHKSVVFSKASPEKRKREVNVRLDIEREVREQYEQSYKEIITRKGYTCIHNGYENVKTLQYTIPEFEKIKLEIENETREKYEKSYKTIIERHGYKCMHNGYEDVNKLDYYTDLGCDTHLILVLLGQSTNKTNDLATTKSAKIAPITNARGKEKNEEIIYVKKNNILKDQTKWAIVHKHTGKSFDLHWEVSRRSENALVPLSEGYPSLVPDTHDLVCKKQVPAGACTLKLVNFTGTTSYLTYRLMTKYEYNTICELGLFETMTEIRHDAPWQWEKGQSDPHGMSFPSGFIKTIKRTFDSKGFDAAQKELETACIIDHEDGQYCFDVKVNVIEGSERNVEGGSMQTTDTKNTLQSIDNSHETVPTVYAKEVAKERYYGDGCGSIVDVVFTNQDFVIRKFMSDQCVLCLESFMDGTVQRAQDTFECHHLVVCVKCMRKMQEHSNKCPICQTRAITA
jgi:flagellar hook protein FlgE